jgi:catechol 2,3-dioxygenase-like lactoylglutathione lyase family enzyme
MTFIMDDDIWQVVMHKTAQADIAGEDTRHHKLSLNGNYCRFRSIRVVLRTGGYRRDVMPKGIVSARHVDHVGLVVPDLNAAVVFFEEALGAQLLWRVGPFRETPTGVPIGSVSLAMLRLGPNINVELQTFVADAQNNDMPKNIDMGAGHIAFFVDDIHAAAESLKAHGAELLHGPIKAQGDVKKGEEIWYFKTPWGAFMEILWRPDHLGYETDTPTRIFQPHDQWPELD